MKFAALVLVLLLPVSVYANGFKGCSKQQSQIIRTAIIDAKALAVTAAASVKDTQIYDRWFGRYTPAKAETVRKTLKSIVTGIRTGAVTAQCTSVRLDGCERETYAFVYTDEPYLIHICPQFFSLPKMSDLQPGDEGSNNGTRAGTIIHEISHFETVASTEDECYSRDVCSRMASRTPARAVINADSYQYFSEDVTFYAINPDAWDGE